MSERDKSYSPTVGWLRDVLEKHDPDARLVFEIKDRGIHKLAAPVGVYGRERGYSIKIGEGTHANTVFIGMDI